MEKRISYLLDNCVEFIQEGNSNELTIRWNWKTFEEFSPPQNTPILVTDREKIIIGECYQEWMVIFDEDPQEHEKEELMWVVHISERKGYMLPTHWMLLPAMPFGEKNE